MIALVAAGDAKTWNVLPLDLMCIAIKVRVLVLGEVLHYLFVTPPQNVNHIVQLQM